MAIYDAHYFLARSREENRAMVDEWVRRGWATRPVSEDSTDLPERSLRPLAGKGTNYHSWQWHEPTNETKCVKCGVSRKELARNPRECI